jgi:uncharacterized protein YbcI
VRRERVVDVLAPGLTGPVTGLTVSVSTGHTPTPEEPALNERGQVLADVSNAIVRIHKRFYGKGPVKARAHLSQDLLTVILEGGFTRGEQTLHDHGHAQEVVRSRLAMQESIESEFRIAVESILYRAVRSFMSANDPSNDLQAEVFVLEPRDSEAVERFDEQTATAAPAREDRSAASTAAQASEPPDAGRALGYDRK